MTLPAIELDRLAESSGFSRSQVERAAIETRDRIFRHEGRSATDAQIVDSLGMMFAAVNARLESDPLGLGEPHALRAIDDEEKPYLAFNVTLDDLLEELEIR